MKPTVRISLICACLLAPQVAGPAFGQGANSAYKSLLQRPGPSTDDVTQRVRPEYEARNFRLGTTIWSTLLDTSVIYDDNVFGSTNRRPDTTLRIHPQIVGVTDWPRHSASLSLSADHFAYSRYSDQDHTDLNAAFSGILDVRHNANIAADLSLSSLTEERGTDDSVRSFDEPVRSRQADGSLFGNVLFGRFYVAAGGSFNVGDYDDTALNGAIFDQDYRDGSTFSGSLRVGYELTTMTSSFVEYRRQARRFEDGRYNSDGNRVITGLAFQSSRLLSGNVYVGFVQQDFQRPAYDDIDSWTFGGDLSWQPTPLLTVKFSGSREADESSTAGSSIETAVGVSMHYEIRRNVILSARHRHLRETFQNGQIDTTRTYGVEAQYLINRNFSATADFVHEDISSDIVAGYRRNRIGLTLRAKF